MKYQENTQTHNQKVHTFSLSATKLGDGLVDPKLVLSWLLTSLGASVSLVGFLVPLREAGALLPQLVTATKLRKVKVRKWWWVFGSLIQGLMVLAILLSAFLLEGDEAGYVILSLLTIFAVARSICSVSYKDVLGKTIEKPKRGLVTGTASSIAAGGVLIFGLLLLFAVFEQQLIVYGALLTAGVLWLGSAFNFSQLHEEPSEILLDQTESVTKQYVSYLLQDQELQKFLLVRGLLTATAVAPPFLLLMAGVGRTGFLTELGGLIVATSLATFVSGRIWGKLSDQSTPAVLTWAGLASGAFLALALMGGGEGLYGTVWFLPLVLFGVTVSYQGVRIARSIHLVNIATEETRAAYTAISNSIIGVVLLTTGFLGALATIYSVELVILLLVMMSIAGGLLATKLE